MKSLFTPLVLAFVVGFGALSASHADAALFATVNGEEITRAKFDRLLVSGAKSRFYHATPPEAQMTAFRREVGQRLIEEQLLLEEAKRRGIKPDKRWVNAQLGGFEERFGNDPGWRRERRSLVREIRGGLEEQSRVQRLIEAVRNVPAPTETELRDFYDARRELFTQPERVRVSMILLKVEPWASADTWQAADAEAGRLVERLRGGASFAETARLHSQDVSSKNGGDLGYVHAGMLGEFAQKAIDALAPGEVSEPVALLEGVGVFRLDERVAPTLTPFGEVRERAEGLWRREKQEEVEQRLRTRLLAEADIVVHDEAFRSWWESRRAGSAHGGARDR